MSKVTDAAIARLGMAATEQGRRIAALGMAAAEHGRRIADLETAVERLEASAPRSKLMLVRAFHARWITMLRDSGRSHKIR